MWPKETRRRPGETPPRADPPSTEIEHYRLERKGAADSSRTYLPGVTGNTRAASTRSGNATATSLERLRRSGVPPPRGEPPLTEIEHHNPDHTSAGDSTRTCLPGVTEST